MGRTDERTAGILVGCSQDLGPGPTGGCEHVREVEAELGPGSGCRSSPLVVALQESEHAKPKLSMLFFFPREAGQLDLKKNLKSLNFARDLWAGINV